MVPPLQEDGLAPAVICTERQAQNQPNHATGRAAFLD